MKFLVRYLLSAFVLAAAVWFGIPPVRGLAENAGMVSAAPSATGSATSAPTAPSPAASSTAAPAPVAAPAPSPAAPVVDTGSPTAETAADFAGDDAPAPAPVEYAPGQEPRQPDYRGPRYDWGVLSADTQGFDTDGKPLDKVPGGTVVEKMSERDSKTFGPMYLCRIRVNRRWQEGYLFPATAVVLFQGPFAFAPKGPSDKVIEYFTKIGQRERRIAALKEEHLRRNPHFATYQAAARAYKDFQDKSKELTARRDAAVGMERSRLIRELESMKNQEPRLRAALQNAEIPYKEWKSQHGDGSEAADSDPEVLRLDREIEALVEDVSEMVPGI